MSSNNSLGSKKKPSTVKIVNDGAIRTIMISRPKNRNAFVDQLAFDLKAAFENASKDVTVKAVILTGDPAGNAFCAGADLSGGGALFLDSAKKGGRDDDGVVVAVVEEADKSLPNRGGIIDYRDSGGVAGLSIVNCTKPVICAINGAAVGVGMTLSCCCDMRVAAEDAKVG